MKKPRKKIQANENRREELLRVCARLLVLGAVNWTAQWYRPGGRLSLDEIAAQASRLLLK